MCQTTKPAQDAAQCAGPLGGLRCGAVCQKSAILHPTAKEAIPEPIPRFLSAMSDSNLLGFWAIRADGRIAASPTWSRPVLPGEPQPRRKGLQRRPVLPGEPAPIRYRQTASGHVVAWDEPGEHF
jgi:hypothetical protein